MATEILVGASIGFSVATGLFFATQGASLYFRFYSSGRLVSSDEIREQLGDDIQLYVFRELMIYNVVAHRKSLVGLEGTFPWKVLNDGLMLRRFRVKKVTLQEEFPGVDLLDVSIPAFH